MTQLVHLFAYEVSHDGYQGETVFSFLTSIEKGREIFKLWYRCQALYLYGSGGGRGEYDEEVKSFLLLAGLPYIDGRSFRWRIQMNPAGTIKNIDQSILPS